MEISIGQIITMIIAIMISFGLPIGGLIYLSKRSKYMVGAFLVGVLSFFVLQVVIRIPIVQLVMMNTTFNDTWVVKILIALILGFTAALFETAGRLASMKWLMTEKRRGYYAGISHGFGHGGIEAILFVGINYIIYLVIGLNAMNKGIDAGIMGSMSSLEQTAMMDIFNVESQMFLMAGIERGLVILFHVGMSLLMMQGIIKHRIKDYFFVVVLIHTVLDTGVVLLQYASLNYWLIEAYLALFAIGSIIMVVKRKSKFEGSLGSTDEGENAVDEGY